MDLKPGQSISVEITAAPRNQAARKTLTRLSRKDPQARHQRRAQKLHRPSWQTWRRGGRQWHHQMKSKPPIDLRAGQRLALVATIDVIRDLASVRRWVKVTPT